MSRTDGLTFIWENTHLTSSFKRLCLNEFTHDDTIGLIKIQTAHFNVLMQNGQECLANLIEKDFDSTKTKKTH